MIILYFGGLYPILCIRLMLIDVRCLKLKKNNYLLQFNEKKKLTAYTFFSYMAWIVVDVVMKPYDILPL